MGLSGPAFVCKLISGSIGFCSPTLCGDEAKIENGKTGDRLSEKRAKEATF